LSKVIDFTQRRQKSTDQKSDVFQNSNVPSVLSFEEQKQKIAFKERRTARRTMFNEMMSSMVVIPERGLLKVFLHDISEDGLSFETAIDDGSFKAGEEITMRIYINHKTYFPVRMTVKHLKQDLESGTIRHGATMIKDASNDVVLQHFVKFVEAAALTMKKDSGDLMVNKTS
jgi:hypothetical protein